MDDLEFRRHCLSDIQGHWKELQKAANQDSARQTFLKDAKVFNQKIKAALDVEIPEQFADKLIWQSIADNEHKGFKKRSIVWSLAASFALTVGIYSWLWLSQTNSFYQATLAHMDHAQHEVSINQKPLELNTVNSKLVYWGNQLVDSIGDVYSANFCQLLSNDALHLVVSTEQGDISVFFVPGPMEEEIPARFTNGEYQGQTIYHGNKRILIVAEIGTNLTPMKRRLMSQLVSA